MKIRKELWFGFVLMALIIAGAPYMLLQAEPITDGHLGLLMLSLVVVAIMLGFPTAFTLMGMGMIFTWLAYDRDTPSTLDLMVQAAYKAMANDVLISIPLFVFMGYLVERANLIEKLFRSLHLALARVPGALAVATLVTCAVFATATGIVGAVVTLMGLLALPADAARRLQRAAVGRRDHRRRLPRHPDPALGAADRLRRDRRRLGGAAVCRRVLPGPDAGRAVHRLRDHPRQDQAEDGAAADGGSSAWCRCRRRCKGWPRHSGSARCRHCWPRCAVRGTDMPRGYAVRQLGITLLPALLVATVVWLAYGSSTEPQRVAAAPRAAGAGLAEPPGTLREPPGAGGLKQPPGASAGGLREPPAAPSAGGLAEPPGASSGGLASSAGRRAGRLGQPARRRAGRFRQPASGRRSGWLAQAASRGTRRFLQPAGTGRLAQGAGRLGEAGAGGARRSGHPLRLGGAAVRQPYHRGNQQRRQQRDAELAHRIAARHVGAARTAQRGQQCRQRALPEWSRTAFCSGAGSGTMRCSAVSGGTSASA